MSTEEKNIEAVFPDAKALAASLTSATKGLRNVQYGAPEATTGGVHEPQSVESAGAGLFATGVVAFSEPAAAAYKHDEINPTYAAALALVQRTEGKDTALEAKKGMEIARIRAAMASTGDTEARSALLELIDKIEGAMTMKDLLTKIMPSVIAAISAAQGKGDGAESGFDTLHKDLYANDAVYRAATDANRKETADALSTLDEKLAIADKRAEEKGYKTIVDDNEKAARKAYEDAIAGGNDPEAYKKLEEWRKIREQQNKERAKQAESKGDTEGMALYAGDTAAALEEAKKKFGEVFEKQLQDLLKAQDRQLAASGILSPEDRKKELDNIEARYRKRSIEVEKDGKETNLLAEMATLINRVKIEVPKESTVQIQLADEKSPTIPAQGMPAVSLPQLAVADVSAAQAANLSSPLPNMGLPELPGLPPLKG